MPKGKLGIFRRLFRSRKKQSRFSPVYIPKSGDTKVERLVRERRLSSKKRKLFLFLQKFLIIIFFIFAIIGSISGILSYVYYLKTGTWLYSFKFWRIKVSEDELNYVVGLEGIPKYPGSHFVFESFISDSADLTKPIFLNSPPKYLTRQEVREVYSFLTLGNSIYYLPPDITWTQVQAFYEKELTKRGWEKILSVPRGSSTQVPGDYYVNKKLGKALHIYTVSGHDIWYETITVEQAKTGLAERIVRIKEQDLAIKARTGEELPSKTFWRLRYPREWKVTVTLDPAMEVPEVTFVTKDKKSYLRIQPVRYTQAPVDLLEYKDLEKVLKPFIKKWFEDHNVSMNKQKISFGKLIIRDTKALESCFRNIKNYQNLCFLLLPNRTNTIYYVIVFWGDKPEFYRYVKRNIDFAQRPE